MLQNKKGNIIPDIAFLFLQILHNNLLRLRIPAVYLLFTFYGIRPDLYPHCFIFLRNPYLKISLIFLYGYLFRRNFLVLLFPDFCIKFNIFPLILFQFHLKIPNSRFLFLLHRNDRSCRKIRTFFLLNRGGRLGRSNRRFRSGRKGRRLSSWRHTRCFTWRRYRVWCFARGRLSGLHLAYYPDSLVPLP